MTTPAILFDYAGWSAAFPAFANISPSDAQSYYDTAAMYCANSTTNPAFCTQVAQGSTSVPLLQRLLWLLTCHLAWLGAFRDANGNPSSTGTVPAPPLVGRVSSASEGSVSISSELETNGYPIPAFFTQTPWGLQFYQATAQFRTAIYVANPVRVYGAIYPSRGGRRGMY